MSIENERQIERDKYEAAYRDPKYRMQGTRKQDCYNAVTNSVIDADERLVDVGCGRGEILDLAEKLGLNATGVEVVPYLIDNERVKFGNAWDTKHEDSKFDIVCCFDVLEHLRPEDTVATLQELKRISGRIILMSANNRSTIKNGVELHINRRGYDEWEQLIKEHCGERVDNLPFNYDSPIWRVHVE